MNVFRLSVLSMWLSVPPHRASRLLQELFPMLPRLFSASLLAFCTALGACGTGTVNYVQIDESYDPVQYRNLPYTGPIYTEVSGNPFAIAQPDLNLIVNAAVQPNGVPVSDGLGPRVHIAFGKTATDIHDACTAAGTLGQAGGKITMTAALCRGTNT